MASMLPTLSEEFTNASLKGSYAVSCISQGGQTESAMLGVLTFDGNGRVSGTTMTNLPGAPFGNRMQVQASVEGTYVVDDNGSGYGSMATIATQPDGSRLDTSATLLITRADRLNDALVAQELSIMENAVDTRTGGLNMVLAIRRPDEGKFSLASLSGTYGGPGIGHGAPVPAAAIGVGAVNFDGSGTFTAVDVQNLPGTLFRERRNATFDTERGEYTLDDSGMGMIIAPAGRAPLVVSRAKVVDGIKIALEYIFVTNDLHALTGNLVTTTVSKRLP
jgi:hypothetical protein